MREMLVQAQKIDHGRHEHDATADPQESHEHADAKSEEEDEEDHQERASLFPLLFAASLRTASIFSILTESRNVAHRGVYTKETGVSSLERKPAIFVCFVSSALARWIP